MPRIFPIYLFTGDDGYLKREAVGKLKKALLGSGGSEAFNFNAYIIGKCDIREVIDTLKSAPFISEKRLVLLKHINAATKGEQQAIVKYVNRPSKSSCLVLESSGREFSGEFYREILKYAREVSFTLPKGNRVTAWIQKEVKAGGKAIRYDAALLLKELKQDDIDGLRQEIDKLITYIGGRHLISGEDVKVLIGSSAPRNVFAFVDALSRKDAKEALAIAKEMFRTKKPIPEILGMIGWQFRRMRKAQELLKKGASGKSAGAKCNVPPFYMERFMKEIKSFTAGEIDRNIGHLVNVDYSIKRGYLKPQNALELRIVNVCTGRECTYLMAFILFARREIFLEAVFLWTTPFEAAFMYLTAKALKYF